METNFKRERVFFKDGGHICMDWAEDRTESDKPPILMIMHGLTGGSETNYIRALVHKGV